MRDNTVSSIKDQAVKAYERARDTVDRVGELVGEGVDQKKSNPGGESAASRPASESNRSVNEERKPI